MRVYFYDIIDIEKRLKEWESMRFPGHLLYGLTHLKRYGLTPVFRSIPFDPYRNRIRLMVYNLKRFLFSKEKYDILYGVTHRGLELLIFLRALKLFKKPIVVWHHSAVIIPENKLRRIVSQLFYKGIDKMFFFSETLLEASLQTGKIKKENGYVIPWGADLTFYDNLEKTDRKNYFISTGRENRDFPTLIKAFGETPYFCRIYTGKQVGGKNYEDILKRELKTSIPANVEFFFTDSSVKEMAEKVNEAFAVTICCLNYPYTVGLTTLVEALALGLPIITTDNPTFPLDIQAEGAGLKVPYDDKKAWINAIQSLAQQPDLAKTMGERGRLLAEKTFNLDNLSREVAKNLLLYKKQKK